MEGKTIVFDNLEEVNTFSSLFATRGTVKVSPVELYDRIGAPENMRSTFEVRPFNPIVADEMRAINKAASSESEKMLNELGYDKGDIVAEISRLEKVINDYPRPISDEEMPKFKKLYNEYVELDDVWSKCWVHGQTFRNIPRTYEIIEQHVLSVENLPVMDNDTPASWSGEVTMEVLFELPTVVLNWLDQEVQRQSKLSDKDIRGL